MSDNVQIDITTIQDNINIDYSYPAGPQGPAGVNEWGTILGTLSTQTDLWRYLSAETFSPSQLTAFLNTNAVTLCSLNVNGQILSAGVDLYDIFLTSETDSQTLSYTPSSYNLTISNGNTVNLSSINSTFAANSGKYESVYSNVQSNSANWQNAYNTGTVYQTNSSSYATTNYVNGNFFPLSGGVISGSTRINNNLTVFGNLTASGTTTFANTVFSVTSALSVVHIGSGPALYVGNDGSGDIASFYDIDQNVEILHVGGINSTAPNVGIKTSTPNKTLTVNGEISANNTIYDATGNSNQWNQSYNIATTYQSASGSFATTNFVQTNFLPLTGGTVTGITNLVGTVSSINTPYYIVGTQPGYGINLLNRANFDPGTPLLVDGRGRIVHGMTFQAGITNFTNNSDHTHVQWAAQNRQNWQMIQNGGASSTNRNTFLLNTVGFNAAQTGFNETNIHSVDTRNTVVGNTFPNIADYVYINFNTDATPRLSADQYVSVTFNPGMAGIVANTYAGTVSAGPITVTVDGNTKYQYIFSLELTNSVNWNNSSKNIENVYTNSSGVKSCRVFTLPGVIPGTYQGLSGNYLNIPRYVLVGIQNHNAYEGETIVLRIATSTKIGLTPASYNGYVKQVLDSDRFVISVGNAINNWYNTTGTYSLSDDWVVYKGSTDAVHQYTPALQHFYFQRFQTSDISSTTTGGNRVVALGNSVDIDGDFSYGLGHNASVFANHAAVFGGEDGLVQGDYSTIVGGIGLVASGTNQFITGKYNKIYNTSDKPFMVGYGSSDANRKNILELTSDSTLSGTTLTVQGTLSAQGNINTSGAINALSSNVGIAVGSKTSSYTLTNDDNNRIIHFDTSTQSLCAIIPASLRTDFNCAIMNTGTNNLVLSTYQTLRATGTTITTQYGSAFVYKDSANSVYAVGRL